jgi:hypothetical protein
VQTNAEKNKPCYRSLLRNLPRDHSPERRAANDIIWLNLINVGNTSRILRKRFALSSFCGTMSSEDCLMERLDIRADHQVRFGQFQ